MTTIQLTPQMVEVELLEQAVRRGQDPSNFATAVARDLKQIEKEADSITDEEARNLLLQSRLENVVPRAVKELASMPGENTNGLIYLLFIVLAAAYFLKGKGSEAFDAVTNTTAVDLATSFTEEEMHYSVKELRTLPREKREAILRAQAEVMAPIYEADLALPFAERELTISLALNDDPILEPEEYLRAA